MNRNRFPVPPMVVRAKARARFALISGAICAVLSAALDVIDASWWQAAAVAFLAAVQLFRHQHYRGYAIGYSRGMTYRLDGIVLPEPTTDTQLDAS